MSGERARERINVTGHRLDGAERGRPVSGPLPPAPPRRPRTTLAVRVTLLVVAVAVLVAVIASVVGVLVVRRTLIDVTTQALSDRADVIAAQLTADPTSAGGSLAASSTVLAEQGIDVVTIGSDGSLTGPNRAVRAARQAGAGQAVDGRSVSGSVMLGALQLVEARSTSTGGFALVAPADVAATTRLALERRLAWAILAGLVAAVLVGFLVARVVSAPLRRTAGLARAMGRGARDLRAPVAGPREVADVSTAVNELADALQRSESRQREFLTSVSHELRTPLAGISGQAQALADEMVPPAEQADVGRSIRGEAARLERLVSDLLDLARLGADTFRLDLASTDLTALLTEMAVVWQVRCDARRVVLVSQLPSTPLVVNTDARRVRQVLDGLAENALRLLGPGQLLVLHLGAEDRWAVLQVRDGGPGLAPEDYPVAFDQGVLHERYRGRRPTGAGLGLALANNLIGRLGGTIVASPAAEGGVAMTIRLPLA
jgi:signal transduction histidine kinase